MGIFEKLFKKKAEPEITVNFGKTNNSDSTNVKHNELNIIENTDPNNQIKLPNYVSAFFQSIEAMHKMLSEMKDFVTDKDLTDIYVYFAIDLLLEFKYKANNVLPKSIVDDVRQQTHQAAKMFSVCGVTLNPDKVNNDFLKRFDELIWSKNVIEETKNYMSKFDNY